MSDFLLQTCWLIPFYGLIGAILSLPWSIGMVRRTGPRPAAYINLLMTVLGFVHGSIAFAAIWSQQVQQIQLVFDWLRVADLDLSLAIEISPVSLGALELVTGISLLAQIYALGYMEKDWSLARFYGLMGFFEAALGGHCYQRQLVIKLWLVGNSHPFHLSIGWVLVRSTFSGNSRSRCFSHQKGRGHFAINGDSSIVSLWCRIDL